MNGMSPFRSWTLTWESYGHVSIRMGIWSSMCLGDDDRRYGLLVYPEIGRDLGTTGVDTVTRCRNLKGHNRHLQPEVSSCSGRSMLHGVSCASSATTGHFCVTENTTHRAHRIVLFAHPSSMNGPLPPFQGQPHPLGKLPPAAIPLVSRTCPKIFQQMKHGDTKPTETEHIPIFLPGSSARPRLRVIRCRDEK
jgi:hypothetical protein